MNKGQTTVSLRRRRQRQRRGAAAIKAGRCASTSSPPLPLSLCLLSFFLLFFAPSSPGTLGVLPSVAVAAAAEGDAISSTDGSEGSSSDAGVETAGDFSRKRMERSSEGLREAREILAEVLGKVEEARAGAERGAEEEEERGRKKEGGDDASSSAVAAANAMETTASKFEELTRRTNELSKKVGEYNRRSLSSSSPGGLEGRLDRALLGEIARRERHQSRIDEESEQRQIVRAENRERRWQSMRREELRRRRLQLKSKEEDAVVAATDADADALEQHVDYATPEELQAILNPASLLAESDFLLLSHFTAQASELANGVVKADAAVFEARRKKTEERYRELQDEWNATAAQGAAMVAMKVSYGNGVVIDSDDEHKRSRRERPKCEDIPSAAETVAKSLVEHRFDGTGSEWPDRASIESGGSVVYELTTPGYRPSPRNDCQDEDEGDGYCDEHYADYDDDRRSGSEGGDGGLMSLIDPYLDIDFRRWYTNYKLGRLRRYLPDDWARVLDYATPTTSWEEYTPRGAVDAVIPDPAYHALGFADSPLYGTWYGRTVGPEVAISDGMGKAGGAEGGESGLPVGGGKPLGSCYPLSARGGDDPAPSFFAGISGSQDDEEDGGSGDGRSPLPEGPKYTVRLPGPLRVDAVSIEHRSFPTPDGREGGRSAPRWVTVVGYPPCPKNGDDDACRKRGFDASHPIDLGTVEYRRITVTGSESDYGAGGDFDDDDEEEGQTGNAKKALPRQRRRRSLQTFPVKNGSWKPSHLPDGKDEHEDSRPNSPSGSAVEETEKEDGVAPQCGFPDENKDGPPSCGVGGEGGDWMSSPSLTPSDNGGDGDNRFVVEAVTFVVERNWGEKDYTCLYRVRVHGDFVAVE